jgi:sterol desaturase/sphingolipid hydroxylase (fatty acid hydroxylase superfamily)
MTLIGAILAAAISLLFLGVLFTPLERAFPARAHQRFFRPAWWTDLCFFVGQYLLWTTGVFWLLGVFEIWIDAAMPTGFRSAVALQPWWVQAIEVVALSDLLIYWGHRLQHRVTWLWRFHSIHHSAEHLDWLAAHREHPVDTVYTLTLINLPAFVLGFPLETLAGLAAFRGLWAIYIHSNVRMPIGPLRALIGAPELHHWHHDRDRRAGNYANLSPLMDLIFGTYRCPDREPEAFGIDEPIAPGYLRQLAHPFQRRREESHEPHARVLGNIKDGCVLRDCDGVSRSIRADAPVDLQPDGRSVSERGHDAIRKRSRRRDQGTARESSPSRR